METKSRIFAPGPTPVPEDSRFELAKSPPYHRTEQFSTVIKNVVELLQNFLSVDWPVVPLTASGTGAMQMAVSNLVNSDDSVLVIESGKFGERWTEILRRTSAKIHRHQVKWGNVVNPEKVITTVRNQEVDIVFGTLVETSTLVRHPVEEIGSELGSDRTLFVVDAISGFAAESFKPGEAGVDAVVIGSQKGLMTPPGLAMVTVNTKAEEKCRSVESGSLYFDLTRAIDRLQRDYQTPWTPALNLIYSLLKSLRKLEKEGLRSVHERHATLANVCRSAVEAIGLELFSSSPSVVGTAVNVPDALSGEELQQHLHEQYDVYVPGGQKHLKGKILRLGHLGDVDYFDLIILLSALEQALNDLGYEFPIGDSLQAAQYAYRNEP